MLSSKSLSKSIKTCSKASELSKIAFSQMDEDDPNRKREKSKSLKMMRRNITNDGMFSITSTNNEDWVFFLPEDISSWPDSIFGPYINRERRKYIYWDTY